MPKRCCAEWLAAKAMLCEVADAKAVSCKVADAKAMLCGVANTKATVGQKNVEIAMQSSRCQKRAARKRASAGRPPRGLSYQMRSGAERCKAAGVRLAYSKWVRVPATGAGGAAAAGGRPAIISSQKVERGCERGSPRGPSVRLLFRDVPATPAPLEFLESTRVGRMPGRVL